MGALGPNPSQPGLGVGPLPRTHFLLQKKPQNITISGEKWGWLGCLQHSDGGFEVLWFLRLFKAHF